MGREWWKEIEGRRERGREKDGQKAPFMDPIPSCLHIS